MHVLMQVKGFYKQGNDLKRGDFSTDYYFNSNAIKSSLILTN